MTALLQTRRHQYLDRLVAETSDAPMGPEDDQRQRHSAQLRCWSVNQARLVLRRDLDKANRYFEAVTLDPRPWLWVDGRESTPDWDFPATNLLRTLLQFHQSDVLSQKAKQRLRAIFADWQTPRPEANRDNDHAARWPTIHTENHDLMCLTIGLFRQHLAGAPTRDHEAALAQSLSWRFQRGWVEWSSPCYQVHYLNPPLLVAGYAPSPPLREGARQLIQLQLAERALLSAGGYLGGPCSRAYEQHIRDDTVDSYLPVMWMTFGVPEVWPFNTEGIHFACDDFVPDALLEALRSDAAQQHPCIYRGSRADPRHSRRHQRHLLTYYNTPHVSLGSMNLRGHNMQARYFNVMFPADATQSLRSDLRDRLLNNPWDAMQQYGEVAQHHNWLYAGGTLVEEGGLRAEKAGDWTLYRVGKGLCAHHALTPTQHVFVVGDLDQYESEREFAAQLALPQRKADLVEGFAGNGDKIWVNVYDLSVWVNEQPREPWTQWFHDCPLMKSRTESGTIDITTSKGNLQLTSAALSMESGA